MIPSEPISIYDGLASPTSIFCNKIGIDLTVRFPGEPMRIPVGHSPPALDDKQEEILGRIKKSSMV